MEINLFINYVLEYSSIFLFVLGILVFITNIIVQVIKDLFPKIHTNYIVVVIAMIITVLALMIVCAVMEITVMWYYAVGAVVLGIFVAYVAMFGFDKFKAMWDKIPGLGN